MRPVRIWQQGYQSNVRHFVLRFSLTFGRSLRQIKCLKLSCYKCIYFLLFWLFSAVWIYHFHCYSMSFLPLYLNFHLDFLHRHPDSPHFAYFYPDSLHSLADSPHPHSHPLLTLPPLFSGFPWFRFLFWPLQRACSVKEFFPVSIVKQYAAMARYKKSHIYLSIIYLSIYLSTRIPIHFSHSHPYSPGFPDSVSYFGLYREPAQFEIFKNLFKENSCFSSKTNVTLP